MKTLKVGRFFRVIGGLIPLTLAGTATGQGLFSDDFEGAPAPPGIACQTNAQCAAVDYCQQAVPNGPGQCTPRPSSCPTVDEPVCGFDGTTYPNACSAAQSGVNVLSEGACDGTVEPTPLVAVRAGAAAAEPSTDSAYTLTLDPAVSRDTLVNIALSGSASQGLDYRSLPTRVTLPAGQTTATVAVVVIDDTLVEGTETVTMQLLAGAGYTLGNARASIALLDNDTDGGGLPTAAVRAERDGAEPASAGRFIVTLSPAAAQPITLALAISGSASPGADYQTLPDSVVVPAGQTSVAVAVNVIDDTLVEGVETVVLQLLNGNGYAVSSSGASASLVVVDNDTDGGGGNPVCGTKTTCGEMTSCDEAYFFLTQCGVTRLDGDGDGIPCEALCLPLY